MKSWHLPACSNIVYACHKVVIFAGTGGSYKRVQAALSVRASVPGVKVWLQAQDPEGAAPQNPGLCVDIADAILVLNEAEGGVWTGELTLTGNLLLKGVKAQVFGQGAMIVLIS